MSMTEKKWQPGDVAVVTLADGREARGMRDADGHGWGVAGALGSLQVDGARPLVVIDPESSADVARLENILEALGGRIGSILQAALREFANPTPPIEEPTGLGAVVEDEDGTLWVRSTWPENDDDDLEKPWTQGPVRRNWQIVGAVRVLSEGVPAEADR